MVNGRERWARRRWWQREAYRRALTLRAGLLGVAAMTNLVVRRWLRRKITTLSRVRTDEQRWAKAHTAWAELNKRIAALRMGKAW